MTRELFVSRFVVIEWRENRMRLRCPPSSDALVIEDPEIVVVLDAFRSPSTIREAMARLSSFDPDDIADVVDMLHRHGALVSVGEEPVGLAPWDPHALYFHQLVAVPQPAIKPTPEPGGPLPVKPPMSDRTIALQREGDLGAGCLAEVLLARRSHRDHARDPIAAPLLAALLWNACRNVHEGDDFVSRVYPSGGATYSLEVYLAVSDEAVDGVGAGVYHYCPSRHLLEILTDDAARAAPFLRAAAAAAQQHSAAAIALLITSRIARVSAKYERIPLSLVFQEAGCLFQTLYLTATALGLAPCAIGAAHGGEELARLAGFDPLEEPVVGRFILGGRH